MKRNVLLGIAAIAFMLIFSGCSKEQQLLNILNGDWKLETAKDSKGDIMVFTSLSTLSYEQITTFFDCNTKDNDPCTGTTKTTRVVLNSFDNTQNTVIDSKTFSYQVHDKSTLVIDGQVFAIDAVSKKSLTIHPVEQPLATSEYSKQ
jgi:hypothetical protein